MNLGLLLKMLGVKLTPEQIAQIEAIIPQLPGKIQEIIVYLNGAVQNFDKRLAALEKQGEEIKQQAQWLETSGATDRQLLVRILEVLQDGRSDDNTRPAGIGATQREYERSGGGNGSGGGG